MKSHITTGEEEVLFNTDTLAKIITYLPSVDLLSLALTCTRFGISNNDESPLVEESARIAVHDVATEEELATLTYYNCKNSLEVYHYLQFMRGPLTFDQLCAGVEYVNVDDKSCVCNTNYYWTTAFSNNIMRSGKHYASFAINSDGVFVGIMRPGKANQNASGYPVKMEFFQQFSKRLGSGGSNNENSIQCCLYYAPLGDCYSSDWGDSTEDYPTGSTWEGSESISPDSGGSIGMLLDLDEGTLSVYKNGRKLGVMKRGLAGPYCWVVSLGRHSQITMKRGTIPP